MRAIQCIHIELFTHHTCCVGDVCWGSRTTRCLCYIASNVDIVDGGNPGESEVQDIEDAK